MSNTNVDPATAPSIRLVNGQLTVNSKEIAAFFQRNHDHLVRTIESLEIRYEWKLYNFFQLYEDIGGKDFPVPSKYFQITRSGFVLIASAFRAATNPQKAAIMDSFAIAESRQRETEDSVITALRSSVPVPVNGMKTFKFDGMAQVRVEVKNNTPWFVAKDVADILGYTDAQAMTRRLDDDEIKTDKLSVSRSKLILINESGLYHAILRSTKPNAKAFRKWVTSEVLPSIRTTGSYTVPVAAAVVHRPKPELKLKRGRCYSMPKYFCGTSMDIISPIRDIMEVLMALHKAGYDVTEYYKACELIDRRYVERKKSEEALKTTIDLTGKATNRMLTEIIHYAAAIRFPNLEKLNEIANS